MRNGFRWAVMGLIMLLSVGIASADTATFEALTSGPSYSEAGVLFTSEGGSSVWGRTGPNGTQGIASGFFSYFPIRATILGGASAVSVDLGDFNQDEDTLFLRIYNASDALLGSTSLGIPGDFVGMKTLSLSLTGPDIAYAIFGGVGGSGSSVYGDNFTYTRQTENPVPEPSSLLALASGLPMAGFLLRRRRS